MHPVEFLVLPNGADKTPYLFTPCCIMYNPGIICFWNVTSLRAVYFNIFLLNGLFVIIYVGLLFNSLSSSLVSFHLETNIDPIPKFIMEVSVASRSMIFRECSAKTFEELRVFGVVRI